MEHSILSKSVTRYNRRESITGYAFIMPAILGFILFCAIPIVYSFIISLTDWNILKAAKFIGFKNYVKLFTSDKQFVDSIRATFQYAFASTVFSSIYAFFLALLLNNNVKGKAF
ncbi:MAG: sugar ABC transporter permease, partial [Clostridia bacterium]